MVIFYLKQNTKGLNYLSKVGDVDVPQKQNRPVPSIFSRSLYFRGKWYIDIKKKN
jgi:hypothetical protein